jgi:hypothetical protein
VSTLHPELAKSSANAVDEIEKGLQPQEGLKNSGLQAFQDYKSNAIYALIFKEKFLFFLFLKGWGAIIYADVSFPAWIRI